MLHNFPPSVPIIGFTAVYCLPFSLMVFDFFFHILKQQVIFFSEHMHNKFLCFCVCGNWTDGVGQAENFLFSVINVSPES